ncbi:MAG: hypothetical protein ACR2NL_09210 [Acidimicrobiia bacterium]
MPAIGSRRAVDDSVDDVRHLPDGDSDVFGDDGQVTLRVEPSLYG